MPPQSVMGDMCQITAPHCHAPCHPPPGPGPPIVMPGAGIPMTLTISVAPTVMVCNMPAMTVNGMSAPMPCSAPPCLAPPVGLAKIKQGSSSVKMCSQDAARLNDPTQHIPCDSGAVPSSGGMITGPGAATVMTGG